MPPRKTNQANRPGTDNGASTPGTPKRVTRSSRTHQKNGNASPSRDELATEVRTCDATQAGVDEEEVVLDEIVVSETPQNTKARGADSVSRAATVGSVAETPKPPKRSSRASSICQGESLSLTPLGRGVPIRKQDLAINIAANGDGKPDELLGQPAAKKRKVQSDSTQRVNPRKSRSKWDNPDEMLTACNSPLTTVNLRELLCGPKAWSILSPEERKKILAKFPDEAMILEPGTPNARPDIAALRNNNNFRNDVARYQEGLRKGFHDPEWIRQAQEAHRLREIGSYDEFLAADFEGMWNVPMPKKPCVGSTPNVDRSSQADRASNEGVNDTPIESKTVVLPEDAETTANPQPADVLRGETTEKDVHDRTDDRQETNGAKVEPRDHTPEGENEMEGHSLTNNGKQAEPAQVEAVITCDAVEKDSQHSQDDNANVQALSVPPKPAVAEVAGLQRETAPSQANKSQEVDTANGVGKQANTNGQAIVPATNGTQKQQDETTPPDHETAEHQQGDK